MTSATRTPHQDQHHELGTRGGGHPDRDPHEVIEVADLAGPEFQQPGLDRAEWFGRRSRHNGFRTATTSTGTAILHTYEGWWVEVDGHAVLIDTTATTTADLLADYHTGSDPAELLASACSAPVEVAGLRLLSPVTAPCRVVALAVNYRSHARDCGLDPQRVQPTFFRKASGSITGPAGPIVRPTFSCHMASSTNRRPIRPSPRSARGWCLSAPRSWVGSHSCGCSRRSTVTCGRTDSARI